MAPRMRPVTWHHWVWQGLDRLDRLDVLLFLHPFYLEAVKIVDWMLIELCVMETSIVIFEELVTFTVVLDI